MRTIQDRSPCSSSTRGSRSSTTIDRFTFDTRQRWQGWGRSWQRYRRRRSGCWHALLPIKKINQSDLFPRVEERSFPKFNPNSNGMNNRKREKKGIASFSPAKFLGKTTDRPPVELIARFSANEQTRRTSYVLVDTEQHSLSLSYRQKSHDKPVDVYFPNTYVYTCMYIYIYTCS